MNSKQKSKLKMYNGVDEFLKTNAPIASTLPNYSQFLTDFTKSLGEIKVFSQEQLLDKSGLIKRKSQLHSNLIIRALDTSKKLRAHASFTNNQVLLSEISISESKLKHTSDKELREYSQGIYDRAQTNINDLETYDITTESQTVLLAAINDFINITVKLRNVRATRKQQTNNLVQSFERTDAALANIDTVVEILKLKEPAFYNEYKLVRKIVELGRGSVTLKGRVLDALTKEPIKNASFVFTLSTNGNGAAQNGNGNIQKRSAQKGGFYIKTLPEGVYNVVITKNGYTEQKTTVAVTNGELNKLSIELVKN